MVPRRTVPDLAPDQGLIGAPSATERNPTVWVLAVALGAFATTWLWVVFGNGSLGPGFAINTLCVYLLYTINHEAAHGLAHRNPRSNLWMGRVAAALEAMTFPSFRVVHLLHHSHTNDSEWDADASLSDRDEVSLPGRIVRRLLSTDGFVSSRGLWKRHPEAAREHRLTRLLQAVVVTSLALAGLGVEVVVLWLLPTAVAGATLAYTGAYLVHRPHETGSPLVSTGSLEGRLWSVAMLNNNQHLAHHLWPRVPWFRVPRLAPLVRECLRKGEGGSDGNARRRP